jgi:hypothetical protein
MTISGGNQQIIEQPKKTIGIIDGHCGGIGAAIIKSIRQFHESRFNPVALGTNAIANSGMLRAGAHKGASGENVLVLNVETADLIIGLISITWPNASLGKSLPEWPVPSWRARHPKFCCHFTGKTCT